VVVKNKRKEWSFSCSTGIPLKHCKRCRELRISGISRNPLALPEIPWHFPKSLGISGIAYAVAETRGISGNAKAIWEILFIYLTYHKNL